MNGEKVKISVAIAAYCGEKFIGEQLQSIAGQSVPVDEVVVCDDSPDGSTRMEVEKFSGILPIRYYVNQVVLGVSRNFQQALSLCTGDIVFLCDQDDVWYPEKVAVMSQMLDPEYEQAVFCDSDVTDAAGSPLGFTHFESRGYGALRHANPGKWQDQLAASCRQFPGAGHDMALTGKLLKKLLPFPDLPACHDNYLGVAAAALGVWQIYPGSLGTFRRHDASASGAGRKMGVMEQLRAAKRSIKEDTFSWNAALFQAVLDRFSDIENDRTALLAARVLHSRNRAAMNVPWGPRLRLIWHEWRSGNYVRFGRGWKNLLQDVFLRKKHL